MSLYRNKSNNHDDNIIRNGDWIIAHIKHNHLQLVKMERSNQLHSHLGCFHHDDIINKPFGSKWNARKSHSSSDGSGYMYALFPSPSLYTHVLSHRTQIIYLPDASWIIAILGLRPGSIVIESGTGSGALSHHILKTISPYGHLYTFEYHQERAEKAIQDFKEHGYISDNKQLVTVECKDITEPEGFGRCGIADAVFLDLPCPWKAILSAKSALKDRYPCHICSFSPCIEQIQQTCKELKKHGFYDLNMVEILSRPYEVKMLRYKDIDSIENETDHSMLCSRPIQELRGHTSYLLFATIIKQ